ncbi:MAG: hypothetical protein JOY73_06710 [Actinobacteria bacterium]|nr:hypothetical protein [Actinomycetota bacterium]
MGRGVIGMGVMMGTLIGSFVPSLWGASQFGMQSLLFSGVGGVIGLWAGFRIAE